MKRLYSLLAAAIVGTVASYAQIGTKPDFKFADKSKTPVFAFGEMAKLSTIKLDTNAGKKAKVPRKLPSPTVTEPIYTQPEGTLHDNQYRLSFGCYTDDFGTWFTDVDGQKGAYVEGNDGKVYIHNPFSTYPTNTWLTATKGEGDTLNVDLPQAIYKEEGTDFFGNPMKIIAYATRMTYANNTCTVDDTCQRIKYIMRNDSLLKVDDSSLLGLCDEYGDWYRYGDWTTAMGPMTDQIITPESPETAQPFTVEYTYTDSYMETTERLKKPCSVVFEGDYIYINGLSKNSIDGWIKGRIEGDKVVFDKLQYIGYDKKTGRYIYFSPIYYKSTVDEEGSDVDSIFFCGPLTISYNADAQTFGGDGIMATNYGRNTIYIDNEFESPSFAFWDQKVAAPKDPVFTELYDYNPDDWGTGNFTFRLYNHTDDGTYLDPDKCYYNVFLDGEKYTYEPDEYTNLPYELTDIPYSFTDKWNIFIFGSQRNLYFNGADWTTVGVQCFYRDDDGTEYRSHRVTAKLKNGETGINSVENGINGTVTYHDLSGRKVNAPTSGIYLKTVTAKDGSKKTTKFIAK